tara:strand:- start:9036 stop:9602 length:567 start_codon:yes stop_codon:yes gene_type:complete
MTYNNTTKFLLPAVYKDFAQLHKNGFLNAYLGDHNYFKATGEINHEDNLYLLFKPSTFSVEFNTFCKSLTEDPAYVGEYDLEANHVMFIFKFPSETYKMTIEAFKQGLYSEFGTNFISDLFPKFLSNKSGVKVISKRWQVLTRDQDRRKSLEIELDEKIDETSQLWDNTKPTEEIYNFDEESHAFNFW